MAGVEQKRPSRARPLQPARLGQSALVLALPGLAALLLQFALRPAVFVDDAFIFYRYAGNWAGGLGLSYNPGEYVEGFSSFLWVTLLTGASILSVDLETAGVVLALVSAAGCLVLTARLVAVAVPEAPLAPLVAALGLGLSPALAFYAASGMDTMVFALALAGAVLAVSHATAAAASGGLSRPSTALACASLVLLALARAEGPAYALLLGAEGFLLARRAGRARALVALPLAASVATVLIEVVRQVLYGRWVPATVSAKSYTLEMLQRGDVRNALRGLKLGLEYEGAVMLVLALFVAVTLGVALRRRSRVPAVVVVAASVVGLNVAIGVWAAGDWMPYRRLLVPVLPLLAALASWAVLYALGQVRERSRAPGSGARIVCVIAAVAVAVLAAGSRPGPGTAKADPRQRPLDETAQVLAAVPGRPHLLTNYAGTLPYHAGARVYVSDLLGLTDLHNATRGDTLSPQFGRTDYTYSYDLPFDLLVTNSKLDVERFFDHLARRPAKDGEYVLYDSPAWIPIHYYVIGRRSGPVHDAVSDLCRCRSRPLRAADKDPTLRELERREIVAD